MMPRGRWATPAQQQSASFPWLNPLLAILFCCAVASVVTVAYFILGARPARLFW